LRQASFTMAFDVFPSENIKQLELQVLSIVSLDLSNSHSKSSSIFF